MMVTWLTVLILSQPLNFFFANTYCTLNSFCHFGRKFDVKVMVCIYGFWYVFNTDADVLKR